MANRITQIAADSQRYINNLDNNIIRVITANQNDIIAANQSQMLQSRDADDNPLTNKQTGSEFLTPLYAKRKNKSKPDLSDTESFQDKMFFKMKNVKEYFVDSSDFKRGLLVEDYGNIFGVGPSNQEEIQNENNKDIINDYFNKTVRK